jgi:hypothetical protein
MNSKHSPQHNPPDDRRPAAGWKIAGLLIAAVLTTWRYGPPPPLGEKARPVDFSAARAAEHVRAIAAAPHPRGSAENGRVRDYLVAQLQALGLQPEIQRSLAAATPRKAPAAVENVFAVMPGTERGPAVALVAHYDSVPSGPGASDDGAAVGALLETARALLAQGPRRDDILLLFTDGEEVGLLGARAFVAENKRPIGLVLNFDARGTSGSSIMFETSERNGRLIAEFAAVAPHKIATSLTNVVYRRMPNGTDFTVFRQAGLAGLNFAFIGGQSHYHRASDSIENLDLATLQHTGDYLLALTRHFAAMPLPLPTRADEVYFTWIPPLFFHYPLAAVWPLTLLLVIVAALVAWRGARSTLLSWSDLRRSALALAAATVAAAGWGWGVFALRRVVPSGWAPWHAPLLVAALLAAATAHVALKWAGKRSAGPAPLAMALAAWTALALAATFAAPGASYLFVWPALLGWVALGLTVDRRLPRWIAGAATYGAAIATAALVGPTCFLLAEALAPTLPLIGVFSVLVCWLVPLGSERAPGAPVAFAPEFATADAPRGR